MWWDGLFPRRRRDLTAAVTHHGQEIVCARSDGPRESLPWAELETVELVTTDEGPFVEDVFLVLTGGGKTCVVPQGAVGFGGLLERLGNLPGFDHGAVGGAMCSVENARFLCWRSPETSA